MTVGEVLRRATEYLAGKGVESPRLDAEHLLGKALGMSRVQLYMHHDRPLSEAERDAFRELTRRRGEREPLAYVLGEWGFRRLTLKVDRRALVPRPETEVLVERCLELIEAVPAPDVVDVGTGTGARALARENGERAGVDVRFEQRDFADGLGSAEYDLVVSNPPYVAPEEFEALEPEVRDWEPRLATVGTDHTRVVAERARDVLRPGGHLVLEVADQRSEEAADLLEALGYGDVRLTPDLTGRDRIVEGKQQ